MADEAVADPRLADEVLSALPGSEFNLLAQLRDEHPEVLGLIDGVGAPDRREDRAMRQHAIAVVGQQRQQIELFRRQADFLAAAHHATAIEVDRDFGRASPSRAPRLRLEKTRRSATRIRASSSSGRTAW